jgi:hypothetical protein
MKRVNKMFSAKRSNLLTIVGSLLAAAILLASGSARADGAVIAPSAIAAEPRAKLETQIAAARAKNPKIFTAARAVDTHLPSGMKRLRKNEPSTVQAFRRLGPPALFALLEMTAWNADTSALSSEQRRALGGGLLQALSVLRDSRAAPVLEAAFLHASDSVLVEHAAEGLGMLCGSSERALLLSHSAAGSTRRAAAVVGLGYCRTPESAKRLSEVLAERPTDPLAHKALRALGLVASSWALAADRTIDPKDAEAIQRTAARALVLAYPDYRGASRKDVHRALLMVENPVVSEMIAKALPTLSADARRGLEQIELRLRKNRARAQR